MRIRTAVYQVGPAWPANAREEKKGVQGTPSNHKRMGQSSDTLQQLTARFREEARSLSDTFRDIEKTTEEGFVPSSDQRSEIGRWIDALESTQKECYAAAANVLGKDAVPPKDASVLALQEAVVRVESQQGMKDAVRKLSQFLKVTSHQSHYSALLGPLQSEASDILTQIQAAERVPEEHQKKLDAVNLFLRALYADPGGSELQVLAGDLLVPYYSADVRIGFFTGAFSAPSWDENELPSDWVITDSEKPEKTQPSVSEAMKPADSDAADDGESAESAAGPAAGLTIDADSLAGAPASGSPAAASSPENSKAAGGNDAEAESVEAATEEIVKEAEPLRPEDYIASANKVRQSASASVFKKGLRDLGAGFPDLPSLLQMMSMVGAASANAIYGLGRHCGFFSGYGRNDIYDELCVLARKGWVARYNLAEEDEETCEVFGLSYFCAESMRKESVASLMRRFSRMQSPGTSGFGMLEPRSLVERCARDAEALLYYLDNTTDSVRRAAFRKNAPLVSWTSIEGTHIYCGISVEVDDETRFDRCQIVHKYANPASIHRPDLLYVQLPGDDGPGPEWDTAAEGALIVFSEGNYTVWQNESIEESKASVKISRPAPTAFQPPGSAESEAFRDKQSRPGAALSLPKKGKAGRNGAVLAEGSEDLPTAEAACKIALRGLELAGHLESDLESAAIGTSETVPASAAEAEASSKSAKSAASVKKRGVQATAEDNAGPSSSSKKAPAKQKRTEMGAAAPTGTAGLVSGGPVSKTALSSAVAERFSATFSPRTESKSVRATENLDAVLNAADKAEVPSDEMFVKAASELLLSAAEDQKDGGKEDIMRAVLLTKAASMIDGYTESQQLSSQLQLATGLIMDDLSYSSMGLEAAFPDPEQSDPALLYGAYALALMRPDSSNDYLLRARAKDMFSRYEEIFPRMPEFKGLFRSLLAAWEKSTAGFSDSVMALLGTNSESESYISDLRGRAKEYLKVVLPTTQLKPLVPLYNMAFGPGSDLYISMDIIARDARHKRRAVEDTVAKFCEPGTSASYVLSEDLIEEALDEMWSQASSKNFRLEYVAKDRAMRNFRERLQVMVAWLRHIHTLESWPKEMATIKKFRDKLRRDLDAVDRKPSWKTKPHAGALRWLVDRMKNHLGSVPETVTPYAELLKTGRFWLDNGGVPELGSEVDAVTFYEPWRRAAFHIRTMQENPNFGYKDAAAEILDEVPGGPSGLMDNLYQLESMGRLLGSDAPEFDVSDELRETMVEAARDARRELEEHLDISYALGQLRADEKSAIQSALDQFEGMFFEKGDFASWRRFLWALAKQIEQHAEKRIETCTARIESLRASGPNSVLLDKAEQALREDRNFTIAEEYVNRHESGDVQCVPSEEDGISAARFFADFRNPQTFQPLLDECRRNGDQGSSMSPLRTFGTKYLKANRPSDWTARHAAESEEFLQHWPSGKGTSPEQIRSFMRSLGFDATDATLSHEKGNVEVFEVDVNPTPRGKKDYAHPIAAFGTRMEPKLNVVAIYGKCIEDQLVETMSELDFDDTSIVLLDYHMDPGQRRRLAEIFHRQTRGQNRYLVVDRVLALYLALRKSTERLKAMLQCTLPYTAAQPFGGDGGSTPDEMFCGREKELESIMSADGASVVYGGRQLGKTALLQRAQSRFHTPSKRKYAVYTNILRCTDEDKLAEKLSADISAACGDAVQIAPSASLDALSSELRKEFDAGRISSMLLLLDEADEFLKGIASEDYSALQPLVELRQATQNRFKFVLAGLHNVCRAERAMANNGVFGQLGTPLCIRPFQSAEASRLLSRPLQYLGFEVPEKQLETLITNSNFYPGVLQFIGYMLVETLPEHYQQSYYSAAQNPPFRLEDGYLGAVLKSKDLNASIQSKVRGTLELDPRYFMIARTIALLSFLDEDGEADGYDAESIRDMARSYGVACLSDESASSFATLLDEMTDMGLLISRDGTRYRFRRDSFKDIVGTDADQLEELLRSGAST